MSKLEAALLLQSHGFHVFPLVPNGKLPMVAEFPEVASNSVEKAQAFWIDPVMDWEQPYNVGISTSRFKGKRLVVLDVDDKDGKDGSGALEKLRAGGKELPETFTQTTTTGGRHFVFWTDAILGNSASRIAVGLDVRASGGFIVGAGSEIDDKCYSANWKQVAKCPQWLETAAGATHKEERSGTSHEEYAHLRATQYLLTAPQAVEFEGANHTTFVVAANLKDLGVHEADALELMDVWNQRNEHPWDVHQLKTIIANAYSYGRSKLGSAAPENEFTPIIEPEKQHPFDELNKEYAFITAGGGHHILWETTDNKGRFQLQHLAEQTFHRKFASKVLSVGNGKTESLTKLWMCSGRRRSYRGFTFQPGTETPDFYNLFRGFSCTPLEEGDAVDPKWEKALKDFLYHALVNVCDGHGKLFDWLMNYFAHLVQKPQEKPHVALVFKGKKGVGKNALVDRIGSLLGCHYMVTANRRYLVSNFNGHLENLLLFVLDEAFWSGEKQIEGIVKDLITGNEHIIEHKGKEAYAVDNLLRLVIIGNDEWLVPASQDERRYAVFNVGAGNKEDHAFFEGIERGMNSGGNRLLMRYLMNRDISKFNPNKAPVTKGLLEQKLVSLGPIQQWWSDCLHEGEVKGSEFRGWPHTIAKESLRDAFRRHLKDRGIGGRTMEDRLFIPAIREFCPDIGIRGRIRQGEELISAYNLPELDDARRQFSDYLGHPDMEWEE